VAHQVEQVSIACHQGEIDVWLITRITFVVKFFEAIFDGDGFASKKMNSAFICASVICLLRAHIFA
jgi:hypothetical protein